ncbi:MAG: glycosyl hydrolase family 28-related protein [Candidatus Kapaibacterium sp.]
MPPDRITDWHSAGRLKDIPVGTIHNLLDYGGHNDGINPNDETLNNLIDFVDTPATILLPPGDYKFEYPIAMRSGVSICGSGHSETRLVFDSENHDHLIKFNGRLRRDTFALAESARRGDSMIYLINTTNLTPGYYYLSDDDSDKIHSSWARNSTGQIIEIQQIADSRAEITGALRRDYPIDYTPALIPLEPIENVRIKGFTLINSSPSGMLVSNIYMSCAVNCEVSCIESRMCNFAHADIRMSQRIYLHDNYFHDAFSFGGGGRAYGVALQFGSGECLIEDNIFRRLRHSVLLQSGANGNVIAFNYSREPYWTEVALPENSAGDLVLHGNYPYLNLFEHNIIQNIVIDDSHGINGPFNTFFRNRAEKYGIFMNFSPPSDSQNFAGNVITGPPPLMGLYFLNGDGHLEYGNNVRGEIRPPDTDDLSLLTLYKYGASEFRDVALPAIGPPIGAGDGTIPAYQRWHSGEDPIDCGGNTFVKPDSERHSRRMIAITQSRLEEYLADPGITDWALYSLSGSMISAAPERPLSPGRGIYACRIEYSGSEKFLIIIIIE